MTVSLITGPRKWKLTRDAEGHREYEVTSIVQCDKTDGPALVIQCSQLPNYGDIWNFGAGEIDIWAWCRLDAEVNIAPGYENEPVRHYEVVNHFTTKPVWRCGDNQVMDPLLEPFKISGSFQKYTEEATLNRFNIPITNSAWEQMRGPQVEFDKNRPTVRIRQNVYPLGIELFWPMIDTVNDSELWGFPPRCIKLSNVSWDQLYYGQCHVYYQRTLEFDIRTETFDRNLADQGTKVLFGHWDYTPPVMGGQLARWVVDDIGGQPANPFNPAHFQQFKDARGENTTVMLNGFGVPFVANDPILLTCDQCTQGTPQFWKALGLEDFLEDQDVILTYQSGCMWSWTGGFDDTATLAFDSGLSLWLLTIDTPDGDVVYANNNPTTGETIPWNCSGINQMFYRSGSITEDIPSAIVVTSFISLPGLIHVEKYNESNFLLLSIPPRLGF